MIERGKPTYTAYMTALYSMRLLYLDCKEWKDENRRPILLNEGTRFEEPFTVKLALAWAERLAA